MTRRTLARPAAAAIAFWGATAPLWFALSEARAQQPPPQNPPVTAPLTTPGTAPQGEAQPLKPVKPAPPPANPLVMPDSRPGMAGQPPVDSQGKPFSDYSRPTATDRARDAARDLKPFGYDFFRPARDLIEAHRSALQARALGGGQGVGGTPRRDAETPRRSSETPDRADERTERDRDGLSAERAPRPRREDGDYRDDPADRTDRTERAERRDDRANDDRRRTAPAPTDRTSDRAGEDPVNAFSGIADPLSQLYRNVAGSVPPTYTLAPGDTLAIRTGSARHEPQTTTQTLDAGGNVTLPDVGAIPLAGLTLPRAEEALRTRLRRVLRGIEVSVTLGRMRTVAVTVSGAAYQPGGYTVPAVATAFNVLYAAGGPTEIGTLRGVELRRQGRLVGTIDVYALLTSGKGGDLPLQNGDLIYIPPRRTRVTVIGEVMYPALFELRDKETLQNALAYAGGVKPSGVAQRVQVNTLVPGSARVLKDVDLQNPDTARALALYDGDVVDVFSVRAELSNRVTVEGAVDQPSDYALSPEMRVSDLVARARGVLGEAYLTRADLYRWNPDNTTTLIPIDLEKAIGRDARADVTLKRWDRLRVYSREEVAWTGRRTVAVRGAVQRPGLYPMAAEMRVSDLLRMAGGPTPDASLDRAVLLHQRGDGTFALDYVDVKAASRGESGKDAKVDDNDVLAVYRVGEAAFEPEHVVSIRGEVVAPGSYPRVEGMRLSDLLNLAGGFKPNSAERVTVARARRLLDSNTRAPLIVSVLFDSRGKCAPGDDAPLEDGDVVTVQGNGSYVEKVHTVVVRGAVQRPGPLVISSKAMRLSDAIKEAGGLRAEAYSPGAQFVRHSDMLATQEQRDLSATIMGLNDLLNDSTFKREQGKSVIERIKAAGAAQEDPSALPIPIPGLGGGAQGPGNATAAAALNSRLAAQELVTPARKIESDGLKPGGNIAVNLGEALRKPGGTDDPLLVDGDVITVPETPTTVQVAGAVFHSRGVLYKPGAKLDYYIAQAGGFAPDAAKDRLEVIHMGGGLIPASKVKAIEPGDVILVPTRVLAEKISSRSNGADSFFRSITGSFLMLRLFGL